MDRRGVKYSFVPTQDVHLSLGEDGNYNNMFFLVAVVISAGETVYM